MHVIAAVAGTLPVVRNNTSTTGTPVGVSRIAWTSGPKTHIRVYLAVSVISGGTCVTLTDITYHNCGEADGVVDQSRSNHRSG